MTLTSTYPTDHILEVSDGRQTMSVAVAHVHTFWTLLQDGTSRTEVFDSQGVAVARGERSSYYSETRNMIRLKFGGEWITWQMFYQLPHVGQVRKEVCWSREELSRVLRAAVVASRLNASMRQVTIEFGN